MDEHTTVLAKMKYMANDLQKVCGCSPDAATIAAATLYGFGVDAPRPGAKEATSGEAGD